MDKFYGFDLGDAESVITRLGEEEGAAPEVLPVREAESFITAYALLPDGELLIGESACYAADAVKRGLRFKSRFLTDPEAARDVTSFASGVLGELRLTGQLIKGGDDCFYVGCPAGWDQSAREDYRAIFEKTGYPPVRIISESRAALVSACQSRYLQVGYDILSRPVLVVDIGSSTTDFAYIMGGREVELRTGGEVFLGGGIMDEILLETALKDSEKEQKIRAVFAENDAWRTYCEFAGRRLKERYFSDEEYWAENECVQTVSIRQSGRPLRLTLRMNQETAEKLLNEKVERLDGRSFRQVFLDSLRQAREDTAEKPPELIFLTGGVSKLPAIRQWCRDVFPEAIVIAGTEPEFSVAKGLAYCGRIDDEMRAFRQEIEQLRSSSVVERIVEEHIGELYHEVVETMVDPILQNAALPVVERWRQGELERLSDIDGAMQREIEAYLHTAEAKALLEKPVTAWLKQISYALEEYTVPICVKHSIPYTALSLNSYLSSSDIEIKVDSGKVFAVEEITWLIDTIISVVAGLLCGGGGIAVIAGGVPGIIAGALISLVVLSLGKKPMQKAILETRIPVPMRKLVPADLYSSRIRRISGQIKERLYEDLEQEKSSAITERLVQEISEQIEKCLTRMAEIVEIPLG
ncbi:MAG: Hsp70 family protein [Lachnospiraceae bacterium]|nr:Hsp70 family protein [Lachnospiraceae bacterium]